MTPSPHQHPTSIGPYPIERELGRGGMGVVYLGRDTRLNRPVAIKVLPEEVARDPMRLSRFEREARTLAALNHRNVGLIYGLEESEGRRLLVLEFVPGATLTQRLTRGPMPLDEAVKICSQIAEGLEAAHEREVVHRDLKPDNIKVTPDGAVKILDFGLATSSPNTTVSSEDATTVMPAGMGMGGMGGGRTPFPSTLTQQGMIMGTPGYMSPEQARGFPIDKRTDIWAFGCVLFECLSGLRCFSGPTPSDMLVAVIEREPDWNCLPARTPARVRELLRKCLVKDSRRRLRDIGDARIELEEVLTQPPSGWHHPPGAPTGPDRPRIVARLTLPVPEGEGLFIGPRTSLAVSPDGAAVAFVVGESPRTKIHVRRLDQPDARVINGTEGAEAPFFSYDGSRLGFFADGRLKVVSLAGGVPLPLTSAPRPQGACWTGSDGGDDWIYFIPDWQRGLYRINASGGMPEPIASPDLAAGELAFLSPEPLPGGSTLMLSVWTGGGGAVGSGGGGGGGGGGHDQSLIIAIDTRTGQKRPLVAGGSNPRYAASGHLLFTRAGSLMAVPLDTDRLTVTGQPIAIEDRVLGNALTGAAQFALGGEGWGGTGAGTGGTLVTVTGGLWEPKRTLLSADRLQQAPPQPLIAEVRAYVSPALSPDGSRLIVQVEGATDQLWLVDLSRHAATRLTFHGDNASPVWSPDGGRIYFRSNLSGQHELYWMTTDGAGTPMPLIGGECSPVPEAITPDGRFLLYTRQKGSGSAAMTAVSGTEIWMVGVDTPASARPVVQGPRSAWGAGVSPDGRTIAFASDDSGRDEVYVQPMPTAIAAGAATFGGRRPVTGEGATAQGGHAPLWLRATGELVYRTSESFIAVRVAMEPAFMIGRPRTIAQGAGLLGSTRLTRNYDAFPSGQQLVLVRAEEDASKINQFNIVLNWFDELRRRSPLPTPTLATRSGHAHTPALSQGAPLVRQTPGPSPYPRPSQPYIQPRDFPPGFNDSKTIG